MALDIFAYQVTRATRSKLHKDQPKDVVSALWSEYKRESTLEALNLEPMVPRLWIMVLRTRMLIARFRLQGRNRITYWDI